jgi:sugar phosphate permease
MQSFHYQAGTMLKPCGLHGIKVGRERIAMITATDSPHVLRKDRYGILGALWFFQSVNYLERIAMSFAGPAIVASMGLGPSDFGLVLSAFAVGYFLAQIPGGMLADRYGARLLVIVSPLLWAAFTGSISLATGLVGLIILRALFGFAEGLSNTSIFRIIGELFAPAERTRATGLWATSFAMAPAFAGPLTGLILGAYGWRTLFLLLMIPALAAALLNAVALPKTERASQSAADPETRPPFRQILAVPGIWMLAYAYFAFNIGYYGFLGWMPTFLKDAHAIDIKTLGLVGGIPYVFGIVGILIFGRLSVGRSDRHIAYLLATSYLIAAAALGFSYHAGTLALALVGLSATAFGLFGGFGLFGALVISLPPANLRASFAGVVTSSGQLGGIIAPTVIGFLVARLGTFASAFAFMCVALGTAAVAVMFIGSRLLSKASAEAHSMESAAQIAD